MGKIMGAYLMPHPPIILKEVGRGEEIKIQNTIDAMIKIAQDIKEKKPKSIILITPHGPLFHDAVAISIKPELKGDMHRFGAEEVKFVKENHLELANKIIQYADFHHILCAKVNQELGKEYNISTELDHGTMVPLYFIDKEYIHYKLISINYGMLSREDLYRFGKAVQEAVEEMEEDVVVIASGDLSHRLTKDAASGVHPSGELFDKKIINFLNEGNVEEILSIDHCFSEEAGECGLRSIDIMLGACDGYDLFPQVLSYEGPFGVGYGVVKIEVGKKNGDRKLLDKIYKNRNERIKDIRKKEDPYVQLARKALESYVQEEIEIDVEEDTNKEFLENKAGAFVSLKKHGELRGCIGTIKPSQKNIAKEIIKNAISAGTKDPRFYPVEEAELEEITYSVDILKEPESIKGFEDLDVKRYGVIVSSGKKTGLLLPNLENVNSVEEQVKIALQKAGIQPNEGYNLERFEVIRHK